jgi:hypothetical protein
MDMAFLSPGGCSFDVRTLPLDENAENHDPQEALGIHHTRLSAPSRARDRAVCVIAIA